MTAAATPAQPPPATHTSASHITGIGLPLNMTVSLPGAASATLGAEENGQIA